MNLKDLTKICLLLFCFSQTLAAADEVQNDSKVFRNAKGCVASAGDSACSPSDAVKSRKKRTLYLPNATFLSIQSRLAIPQLPLGIYLIWIRVRFIVRSMFTEQTAVTNQNFASIFGRSFDNVDVEQVNILKRIEDGISGMGWDGKHCLQRAICELHEYPILDWTLFGEMLTTFLTPRNSTVNAENADYVEAMKVGQAKGSLGECWEKFEGCPISIFNVIPDVHTETDRFNVSATGETPNKILGEYNLDIDLTPPTFVRGVNPDIPK